MKLTTKAQKDQTTLISVTLTPEDYKEKVEKQLKDYRRKAEIKGFRKGMAPMSLVQKMYGKQTLIDTAYHTATQAAMEEIKTKEMETIGDLMPAESQPELDFDNPADLEFVFEVGNAPELKVEFSDKDKVEKVVLTPTKEMLEGYTENFLRRFGKLEEVKKVTKEEAITCTLDNQDIKIEDAYVGLISMNDDERKPFIGKKVGDKMQVNINELYKNESQRAAILSMKPEELAAVNPEFELEITMIRSFVNPEVNEEFLKTAFPDGDVADKKAFDKKMAENVQQELDNQVEFRLEQNMRDCAMGKNKISLPDAFLKRWLFNINEGKFTMEQIEEEYPQFAEMMKWDLVKRTMVKNEKLEITEEDVLTEAKGMALAQFRQYGMAQVEDEMLENYAKQILGNKEEARRIVDRAGEKKIMALIASKVTIKDKKMSVDEFSDLMKKENEKAAKAAKK